MASASPFRPHPLLRNGHLQTLAGTWFPGPAPDTGRCEQRVVPLADGDQLVLLDEAADTWAPDQPVVLLVHGMCGCAESPYMTRIASKLRARGLRTMRLNLRGCGAGHGLARHPYHAGRSDDLQALAAAVSRTLPSTPLMVAGFSLGGNLVLKWLGAHADELPVTLCRAVAVNPPVDLQECTRTIARAAWGLYDRHFARLLYRQMLSTPHWLEDNPLTDPRRRPKRIIDFDEHFTAPRSGFSGAGEYYARSSAAQFVPAIQVPTLIVSSRDDPLVPVRMFESLDRPDAVRMQLTDRGGHLGYIAGNRGDGERHWLDVRIVQWLTEELPRSARI